MKLLTCFIIIFLASMAHANPFLICDPQSGITNYRIIDPDGATIIAAEGDGSARWDAKDVEPGPAVERTLAAGAPWTLDEMPSEVMEWGDPTPFLLGRPSVPLSSTGIGLKP